MVRLVHFSFLFATLTLTSASTIWASPEALALTSVKQNDANGIAVSAPVFTSSDNTTFPPGQARSFTVTSSAAPTATLSVAALPGGLSFTDNGDGTATLASTSANGLVGEYGLFFIASNGIDPDATQRFTLTLAEKVFTDGFEPE